MARRKRHWSPQTHLFRPVGVLDESGEPLCQCNLPRHNARHEQFEMTEEMRAADAARMGERD